MRIFESSVTQKIPFLVALFFVYAGMAKILVNYTLQLPLNYPPSITKNFSVSYILVIFADYISDCMKEIDPDETSRAEAFRLWMNAPMPMVTLFKTLDVSRLVRTGKRRGTDGFIPVPPHPDGRRPRRRIPGQTAGRNQFIEIMEEV